MAQSPSNLIPPTAQFPSSAETALSSEHTHFQPSREAPQKTQALDADQIIEDEPIPEQQAATVQATSLLPKQQTATIQIAPPLGRILLGAMAAVFIPAIIFMYFRQNAELKKSFADYAVLEQTLQRAQQDKDVLRQALASRPSSAGLLANAPISPHPPVFVVHQLGEHDTLLGVGYKFCGVKPGEKDSELEFLGEIAKQNRSDGIERAYDSRLITMPTTTIHGKKVPLGEEGQFWRFPGTCRFPSLSYPK